MISMKERVILHVIRVGRESKIVTLVSLAVILSEMVTRYGYLHQKITTVHELPLNHVFTQEQMYLFVLKKVQFLSDR